MHPESLESTGSRTAQEIPKPWVPCGPQRASHVAGSGSAADEGTAWWVRARRHVDGRPRGRQLVPARPTGSRDPDVKKGDLGKPPLGPSGRDPEHSGHIPRKGTGLGTPASCPGDHLAD